VNLHGLHHHPDHYSHPDEFRPDRWLPTDHPMHRGAEVKEKRAFLPFLSGSRQCAGRQLAETELLVTLHAVLDSWDIQVSSVGLVL
jgi:enediyne biosynthesis protein E7